MVTQLPWRYAGHLTWDDLHRNGYDPTVLYGLQLTTNLCNNYGAGCTVVCILVLSE